MKKKVFSWLLITALVTSLFSVSVFADDSEITADTEITDDSGDLQAAPAEDVIEPETVDEEENDYEAEGSADGTGDTAGEAAILAINISDFDIDSYIDSLGIEVPEQLKSILEKVTGFIKNLDTSGYKEEALELFGKVKSLLNSGIEKIKSVDFSVLDKLFSFLPTDLSKYDTETIKSLVKSVGSIIDSIKDSVKDTAASWKEKIAELVEKLEKAISDLVEDARQVTGVALDRKSVTMNADDTIQLHAIICPLYAKDKSVTWKSSDTRVAKVSSTGKVKAIGGGTADITVTTKDGGKKAKCTITVIKPIYDCTITVSPTKVRYTGKQIKPEVTILDGKVPLAEGTDYTLKYTNNVKVGTATITILGKGYYSSTTRKFFKILKALNTIKVAKTSYSVKSSSLTTAKSFKISVSNAVGKVTFTPDSAAVKAKIKVTSAGKVTLPKNCAVGTYVITVKAAGDSYYNAGVRKVTINVK